MKFVNVFIISLLATLAFSSKAQEFSGGLELGFPVSQGDKLGIGLGGTLRYEGPWGTQTSAMVDAGLLSFSGKTVGAISYPSMTIIPIQAGIKYYFDDPSIGLYLSGQLGFHFISIASESQTDFGYAPGIGYHLEKIDVGIRFQAILGSNNESYNLIGIRMGYVLSEKTPYRGRRR